MKSFCGKTVEEALELAASEMGVPSNELIYSVQEKRKDCSIKKLLLMFMIYQM